MIFSDLLTPAEASVHEDRPYLGFAQAGNRFPSPIGVEDMLFGIMLESLAGNSGENQPVVSAARRAAMER
jgi:hypothetical protein